jgi:nuclear pore complex protein Nup133
VGLLARHALTTVEIGRVDEAYALAEHHRDFETLVMLCHDPKAGRPKVQAYIETFGEDFAFVLYLWYIEKRASVLLGPADP